MRRISLARTPGNKVLAIDWLVHQVHSWTPEEGSRIGRPAAVNLIEGSERKVVAFLDELAARTAGRSLEEYAAWRKTLWLASER